MVILQKGKLQAARWHWGYLGPRLLTQDGRARLGGVIGQFGSAAYGRFKKAAEPPSSDQAAVYLSGEMLYDSALTTIWA
jgi:hypothetical protein